jgi:hypothetical protein
MRGRKGDKGEGRKEEGRTVEVLVSELGAVDRLSTGTVVGGEVTSLEHELGDDCRQAKGRSKERCKIQQAAPRHGTRWEEGRPPRLEAGVSRAKAVPRWKPEPAYPKPFWPVQSSRKFRAVLGTTSS